MCKFIDWECYVSKFAPNQRIITAVSSDLAHKFKEVMYISARSKTNANGREAIKVNF